MNKALSFVRLDFITVKPYFNLKTLAIMVASPLFILITSDSATVAMYMFVVFAALFVSYPFAVSEKNTMDALYPTLSITRTTVVLGRYLFSLTFDLCAALMGLVFLFVSSGVMQKPVNIPEILLSILVILVFVTLVEAVQLPIYFKLGYDKAKMLAYLPFIFFMLFVLAVNNFIPKNGGLPEQITGFFNWIAANPTISIIIAVILWLGLMVISCQTSMAYYRKRDF